MMEDSFLEENESTTIITQSIQLQRVTPASPLKSQKSRQSLNSPSGSIGSPKKKMEGLLTLQRDYLKLERQYTDLLLTNNTLANDHKHLELEIASKNSIIQECHNKILNYEKALKSIQNDYSKSNGIYEKEIFYYKELVEELQCTTDRLRRELNSLKERNIRVSDFEDRYNKLLREFKVLESNFELERNSKLALLDQVEYLTKLNETERNAKNDDYYNVNNISGSPEELLQENEEQEYDEYDFEVDQSIINGINNTDMYDLSDGDDSEPLPLLSYLAEDLKNNHSSPIKERDITPLEISQDFRFPQSDKRASTLTSNSSKSALDYLLSPEQVLKEKKRQSLPPRTKDIPTLNQDTEFVLSPLKLASHNLSYFEGDSSMCKTKKRYSNSKPHHSRYNSHDIFPIMVEFEQVSPNIRSTSVPENQHASHINIIQESREEDVTQMISVRDNALNALNGLGNATSNRDSLATETSKTSSWYLDNNLTNEMTKQEIMKLKFELQSLKLHNEKLLSYIGFELQKQRKNIRRLSSKKSLNNINKKMEYSDAKLIEKSKNMLIHKKRVLRSVSVAPIISKSYANSTLGIISKGLLNFNDDLVQNDVSLSPVESDEDDYGFLKNESKFGKRIFSNSLQAYLNFNEIDDIEVSDGDKQKNIKKYKSQTFYRNSNSTSDYEDYNDTLESITDKSEWEDISHDEIIDTERNSIYNRVRSIIFGSEITSDSRHHKNDQLVDDHLKYKFFTLAISIIIIGLKFSHQNNS